MVSVHLPLLIVFFIVVSFFVTLSLSLTETEALLKFKETLNITKGDLNSWRPDTSPCENKWWGIYCKKNKLVTGIQITRLGLSGTIDVDALRELKDLRTIRLDNNSLSGPIPNFSNFTYLRSLLLSNNQFNGTIRDNLFTNSSLRKVYLDHNYFTGKIPSSLMQLKDLEELFLNNNNFTGEVPPLKVGMNLTKVDLSNNSLTGRIPPGLQNFSVQIFQGNDLCGTPLNKECPDDFYLERMTKVAVVFSITISVLFFIILAIISAKRQYPKFSILGSDNEVLELCMAESNTKKFPAESTTRKFPTGLTRRIDRQHSDRKGGFQQGKSGIGNGDLVMVNEEMGAFDLPDLLKAAAEVLGSGSLGSAYKAVMASGFAVVVKRIKEMDKLGRDAFDVEIRLLGKLRHPNILMPLAYHYRREEKLVISEYMPKNSLLYVLHGDRGIDHSVLPWPTRLRIIQGVTRGMDFLHGEFLNYELPHGNLKSSNVLLNENYEPLLCDYAFLPLINPNHAPQMLFAFKAPEYTEQQQISPKSDVYCLGIVILEILTGKFPSLYLNNGKGGTDILEWMKPLVKEQKEEELIDPEIGGDANSVEQMVEMLRIGVACVESNPEERLEMREAAMRIERIEW